MLAAMTPRRALVVALLALAGLAGGCSHSPPPQRVLEPARVDLSRFGTLGLVEFSSGAVDGFGAEVSREFLAALQEAQPGTPVLELGSERKLLADIGHEKLDPEALRAIAEKYRVDALIVGSLDSQRVSPKVAFDASAFASASAELEGVLDVRILLTQNGATVWSTTQSARAEIAGVQISDHGFSSTGMSTPEDARQRLLSRLVRKATPDFWAHWE